MKFKIGDKVLVKTGCYNGEILYIDNDDIAINYLVGIKGFSGHSGNKEARECVIDKGYEEQCHWFGEDELKSIEEKNEMKFKIGDKVKTNCSGNGEVLFFNSDDSTYLIGIKGYNGHNGVSCLTEEDIQKYIFSKGYGGQCTWFKEEQLEIIEEKDEMKFKIGDKVKTSCGVGEILYIDDDDYAPYLVGIKGYGGGNGDLILTEEEKEKYVIDKGYDDECLWFDEDEMELIKEEVKTMNKFTKDDLKTGMIVQTRNGGKFLVLKEYETKDGIVGIFLNINKNSFISIGKYNQDMNHIIRNTIGKGFDIMKVWDIHELTYMFLDFDTSKRKLLFDREKEDINYNDIIIDENSYNFLCSINKKYKYIGNDNGNFYIKKDLTDDRNRRYYINSVKEIINSDFEWLKGTIEPLEIEKLIEAYRMKKCCCCCE